MALKYSIFAQPGGLFGRISLSRVRLRKPWRRRLMKRLFQAAGLFAIALCSLPAQTSTSRAEIPFDFRMGTTILPAGTYFVQQSGYLLTVREEGGTSRSVMQL